MNYLKPTWIIFVFPLVFFSLCAKNVRTEEEKDTSKVTFSSGQDKRNLMFPSTPAESTVLGEIMKAFIVAHNAFVLEQTIPERKKHIENYTVEFRQDKDAYFIYFLPKIPSGSKGIIGGETELAVSVTYAVSKSEYKVLARQFYK